MPDCHVYNMLCGQTIVCVDLVYGVPVPVMFLVNKGRYECVSAYLVLACRLTSVEMIHDRVIEG